jgi:hypothetical protein
MNVKPYADTATEAGMLATLREAIELAGGCHYRINDSRMQSMTGWPDLLAFVPYGGRGPDFPMVTLLGFELKTAKDRTSEAQHQVRDMLNRVVHVRSEIVRAGRLRDGEITLDEALAMVRNGQ